MNFSQQLILGLRNFFSLPFDQQIIFAAVIILVIAIISWLVGFVEDIVLFIIAVIAIILLLDFLLPIIGPTIVSLRCLTVAC